MPQPFGTFVFFLSDYGLFFSVVVRPYDVRLWQAQGMCYEEIGRYADVLSLS